jgi:hypothetical protein
VTSNLAVGTTRFLIRIRLTMAATGSQFFLVTFCPILGCNGWMNTATNQTLAKRNHAQV